jgi:hypothetical protein
MPATAGPADRAIKVKVCDRGAHDLQFRRTPPAWMEMCPRSQEFFTRSAWYERRIEMYRLLYQTTCFMFKNTERF